MKIIITESQYSTLIRRYSSPASIEVIVKALFDVLDVKKYDTFDIFYEKVKEGVNRRIWSDMLVKGFVDKTEYINNEIKDLDKKIKKDIYSYIDDNLKDKIENHYNKHSKKQSKKKSNLDEVELTERCWKGYTQKGMKTMFGKRYPNCVKIKK